MATSITAPRDNTIKFEYGQPQTFALRFIEGKEVPSNFGGMRVMFSTVDERKFFVDGEDASIIEHRLLELGVRPAEFITVTKVKNPRGAGHSFVVTLAAENEDSQLARNLERSIAAQSERRAAAPVHPAARQQEKPNSLSPAARVVTHNTAIEQAASSINPTTAKLCAAFMCAIDSMNEARAYSKRCGFGDIVFNSEDLRAVALTAFIQDAKGGYR
jgi:hypothetical protein